MGVGTGEVTIATGPGFTNFLAGAVIGYECRIGSYTAAMGNNLTIKCAGSWRRADTDAEECRQLGVEPFRKRASGCWPPVILSQCVNVCASELSV